MDKTAIYQLLVCVLSRVFLNSQKKITGELLTFIQTERHRSGVMTSARLQPFCRKSKINVGCFDGTRINPRNIAEGNTTLLFHINHFCLIWKSNGLSFNQVIKDELKPNFKAVDYVISDKHVKNFVNYDYHPKKVQSPLTNIVVYDSETFIKIRADHFVVVYLN